MVTKIGDRMNKFCTGTETSKAQAACAMKGNINSKTDRETCRGLMSEQCQNERNIMTTELNTDKLVKDLRNLTRDAEELVEATAGEVSERAKDARKRLGAAVDTARASCEKLQEKAVAGAKVTDKVIRDHPYQSLGIAFGAGLLIGVLVNRK
jgi:ElaB/YqjD/DUF883 family membrane-anchored ribosome-binding protein